MSEEKRATTTEENEKLLKIAQDMEKTPAIIGAIEARRSLRLRGKVPDAMLFKNAVGFIDALSAAVIVEASAREEEIRLLHGTIDAQDERERLAGEKCGMPAILHGCDWPDAVAEEVIFLRDKLEGKP